MRIKSILAAVTTAALFWSSDSPRCLAAEPQSAATTKLIGITPTGDDVELPNQIVFQFSEPVIPLGRMERTQNEISIAIGPALSCEWRWMNTSALACNLSEGNLPREATTYSLTVPKAFDSTRGELLANDVTASFTTKRPAVTFASFKNWIAPGQPILEIAINQKVSVSTLLTHLVLEDGQKRTYPFTLEHSTIAYETEEQGPTPSTPPIDELRWMLTPKEELPLDTEISLKVIPGLLSQAGPELGVENRTVVAFHTFPQFEFLGVGCFDTKGDPLEFLKAKTPEGKRSQAKCDPLNAVNLLFNAPVLKDQIKSSLKITPDLTGGKTDFDPWADVYSDTQLQWSHGKNQKYAVSLPYGLKANANYALRGIAASIHDEFGRQLNGDLSASFSTGHRAPRYVLDNQISVLEKDVDSKLPVIVNNLNSVKLSYQLLTSSANQSGLTKTLNPYNAQDIAYPYPIDVRGMLGGQSGVIQGTLSTTPQTAAGSRWFFSQVTPYEVHAKLGHFSSAVWVTSFSTGQPISDATVSIEIDTLTNLSKSPLHITSANTDATGIAHLPGTNAIDPKLKYDSEWDYGKPHMFVRVAKDGDVALLPLIWDFRAYAREEYQISRAEFGHIHTWGTTAQGVYKAGDTVDFNLWVRDQNDNTFIAAPRSNYRLEVTDPTGKVVFTVPDITLSEFGSFGGRFLTKKDAAVGWYSFSLKANFADEAWEPLRVLVSDFTPASFKVASEIKGTLFHQGDTLNVATEARLHAGGPYSNASTRVTALIRSSPIEPSEPQLSKLFFESPSSWDSQIYQREEKLNSQGDLSSQITIPSVNIAYGNLIVESAVRDDRGRFVANTTKARFVGRSRYIGIEQPDWLLTAGKEAVIKAAVIDSAGKAVAGSPVSITVELEETKAVRIKSAGNVYATKYENTWTKVHDCSLTSTSIPLSCSFTPRDAGEYRITASVTDDKGLTHQSSLIRWASGQGTVLWNNGTNTELEIIPERKSYQVGETARFLIQNPFPGSQALLTTERYGIQKSWTKVLTASTEVIEVPVTRDQIPGFYFSATVVSPRVAKSVEGTVDLGKPAFRMGYTKIDVIDPSKQLRVDVVTSGKVFRPRDTVTVSISAKANDGSTPSMEYAVSVLDEAVLDLIQGGKTYFDPYKGFYTLDPLDVKNYNLIKMLVGLQKFETKGATPGGDGGSTLDMRSIKKYVSYWNPSVRPDEHGRATVSFEAPDNLTGWKVLVMAVTKDDQMGLGTGTFTVNKNTEIRPALPNQVREGDSFNATFTVMNRTDKVRKLSVDARAEGVVSATPATTTIEAEPFKRYPVNLQVKAQNRGTATFSVTAGDASDRDAVTETLTVLPRAAVRTSVNFGSSDESEVKEPIEFPADLQPGVGSVGVILSRSILGGLEGAFTYMKDYPYLCWEQKLSKAVMAAHANTLKRYLPKTFEWKDAEKLVVATLADLSTHQAPNGGMTFYQVSNEHVSQYLSAYTALALTWLRDKGYQIPEDQENKLHQYLMGLLKNEEFPTFFSTGMKSSVRAVALAALARRGKITLQDLLRYSPAVKEMNVFGKANYLSAALELSNSKQHQRKTFEQILSFANQTASTLSFTETVEALSVRILDSNVRTQCTVLDTFVSLAQSKDGELSEQASLLAPKLVRSITLEQKRKDRWQNTQENLFCMNALARYSAAFEKEAANLDLTVRIGAEELARVSLKGVQSEPLEVSRALTAQDAGRREELVVAPTGKGRFYYASRLAYAPKDIKQSATNSGMELSREYSVERNGAWTLLKGPVVLQPGEIVKVDLFLRVPGPRNFVVIEDPIPGGLEPVNRDLATASTVDADKGAFQGAQDSIWFDFRGWIDFGASFWSFYHKEVRHSSARFYSEYLPAGNYHLTYVSQAIASGEFIILPAHAEEMYDAEVFGDSAPGTLRVTGMQ